MNYSLTPNEIYAAAEALIRQASNDIGAALAKNNNNVQKVHELLNVSVPYVRNVRDTGSLGTLKKSVLPIAVRVCNANKSGGNQGK